MRGTEVLSRHAGANDIDAIELGLGRDLIGLAGPSEVAVVDVEGKVLGHLLRIHDFANSQADLGGSVQVRAFAANLSLNARKFPFGRDQKRLALARAFGRQIAVAAHDQPLARKVGRADFGKIPLVEQRELQRPMVLRQGLDLRRAQAGDPVQA